MTPTRPRLRFPKTARLRTGAEFRAVRSAKRGVSDEVLHIAWRRNALDVTRLGLAITIRGIGAVTRNRVKRVLREVFRLRRAELPVGFDLVITARSPEAATDFALAARSFEGLMAKIRVASTR